jgi:hypothetical protein
MPHCQDPPPIFGPSPRSGGGRTTASSPNASVTVGFAQLPEYRIALWPLTKSAVASLPDFADMEPSATSPCIHSPHATASGPFSTPSALVYVSRSTRSPPKLCRNGEYAYGSHSPVPPVPRSRGYGNCPVALRSASTSASSCSVHGSSIVGIRAPTDSSTDFLLYIASATS